MQKKKKEYWVVKFANATHKKVTISEIKNNPYGKHLCGRRTYLEGILKLIIANVCAGTRVAVKNGNE